MKERTIEQGLAGWIDQKLSRQMDGRSDELPESLVFNYYEIAKPKGPFRLHFQRALGQLIKPVLLGKDDRKPEWLHSALTLAASIGTYHEHTLGEERVQLISSGILKDAFESSRFSGEAESTGDNHLNEWILVLIAHHPETYPKQKWEQLLENPHYANTSFLTLGLRWGLDAAVGSIPTYINALKESFGTEEVPARLGSYLRFFADRYEGEDFVDYIAQLIPNLKLDDWQLMATREALDYLSSSGNDRSKQK